MTSPELSSLHEYESDDRVCGNCNFYSSLSSECRFDPPTRTVEGSGWPGVKKTDWCGRFEHAPTGSFGTKQELLARSTGG